MIFFLFFRKFLLLALALFIFFLSLTINALSVDKTTQFGIVNKKNQPIIPEAKEIDNQLSINNNSKSEAYFDQINNKEDNSSSKKEFKNKIEEFS